MRILVLSIIALVSLYTFFPRKLASNQIDEVKMKLSAPNREQKFVQKIVAPLESDEDLEVTESDESEPESTEESSASVSSAATEEDEGEEPVEPLVGDHEKGWQDELSQVVVELEPEHGEEMFNAYVSERNAYQSSLDELIRGNQKNQDLEFLIGELENKHEEQVQEIFGSHYEAIKEHHSKFLESTTP